MASLVLYLDDDTAQAQTLTPDQPTTLGRHSDNVLQLSSESVSSRHAVIAKRDDGWYVQDLGSSNGTRVNGAPIEEALLVDGDRLNFGSEQAIFYLKHEAAVTAATGANQPRIAVPAPDTPVTKIPAAPPPPPMQRKLPAERLRQTRSSYPGADTSALMNTIVIMGLCLFAVVLGLALRHQSETGRNFFSDAFGSLSGKVPRITIEKKTEQ